MCLSVCLYVYMYTYIHTHTYIFQPQVKWSLNYYANKYPLREGACSFREASEKYKNQSVLNLEFKS